MFYSNGHATAYDELISFYPMFYREVLEMRAILEAEGHVLDDSAKEMYRVLDNNFIDTADNATIERLEKFLRITPEAGSSYEDRRRNVKLYFTGFGKISATKLKEMLFPFTETEAKITFAPADESGNNLLAFEIPRGEKRHFSSADLMELLARRIPAHLWYGVTVIHSEENKLYFGTATILLQEMGIPSVEEDVSAISYLVDELGNTLTDELGNILIL